MAIKKLSDYDSNQITKFTYDEDNNAQRVKVVGQELSLNIDAEALKRALEGVKIDIPQPQTTHYQTMPFDNTKTIEKTVYIPEIKEVEKIIVQTEYKEIEKPVVVIEYKEIEKPVIITQETTKIVEVPVITEKLIEKMPAWGWSLIVGLVLGNIIQGVIK